MYKARNVFTGFFPCCGYVSLCVCPFNNGTTTDQKLMQHAMNLLQ